MAFAERFIASCNSSNLLDDEHHHLTEALCAAALADSTGVGIGSLLSRVKYADGTISKLFEGNPVNLAHLLRIWTAAVTEKGTARGWIKVRAEWDIATAPAFYNRVAYASLAYWLDGRCAPCGGAGQLPDRRMCSCCKGSGKGEVSGHGFERERVLDMVSELEGLLQAHNARAAARMRRST